MRRLFRHRRAAVVTLAIGAVAVGLRLAIPRLQFFRIGAVEVVGLRYLTATEVVSQLGIAEDAHILTALGPIGARASLVPGLRAVRVSRRWPAIIRLDVEEAPPVAMVIVDGEARLMDDRAQLLPYPPGRIEQSLPLASQDSATAALLGRLRRADPVWYSQFDQATGDHEDLSLLAAGYSVRLRSDADDGLLRRLAAIREWLNRSGIAWSDIDLRFRGRVFVRREQT
jgi:cell division septal protein FtsQ